MKVYCFYLIKNEIEVREFHGIVKDDIHRLYDKDIALYAFTPSKESEAFFLETRDNTLFFEKIVEMTHEEYEEFCEEHKECLIEYHSFNTKKIINGKYKVDSLMMLCTLAESDCIIYYKEEYAMKIISDILDDQYFNLIEGKSFNKKIKRILDKMFLYEDILSKVNPLEDINYENFIVDDVALYVKLFSNTLKKGYK